MRLAFVALFRNHSKQVQITGRNLQRGFFKHFAHGAFKGRFASSHFQFSAGRAPAALIRSLGTLNEEQAPLHILEEHQDTDFKG